MDAVKEATDADKGEGQPTASDPAESDLAADGNNKLSIERVAVQGVKDWFDKATEGEKLGALLLTGLLANNQSLGNEILADLRSQATRLNAEAEPDGLYLVGLVQGLSLAKD